jgi:hypothetical protein
MLGQAMRSTLMALAILSSPMLAQAQPQQQRVPAPDQHPATGAILPAEIGGAQRVNSIDYGKSVNRPELGYSWSYKLGQRITATAYLYTLNVQNIPDGPSSPPLAAQFKRSLDEIYQAAEIKHYDQLRVAKGPADCTMSRLVFRCVTLSAMQNGWPLVTSLMMTGYRGHFLKLRLDLVEGGDVSQATGDRLLQALVSAIAR